MWRSLVSVLVVAAAAGCGTVALTPPVVVGQTQHDKELALWEWQMGEAQSMVGGDYAGLGVLDPICPHPNRELCRPVPWVQRFHVDAVTHNDDGIFLHVVLRDGSAGYVRFEQGRRRAEYLSAGKAVADQESARAKAVRAAAARANLPGVSIGMTGDEVRKSSWGAPVRVNQTITARGTREQWVYGYNYLYFEDGVLVGVQQSR